MTWFSINKEDLSVSITDLNNVSTDFQDLTVTDNIIKRKNEVLYAVEKPNIRAKSKEAICLKCRTPIKYIDPETRKHYLETKNTPPEIKKKSTVVRKICYTEIWWKAVKDILEIAGYEIATIEQD